MPKYKYVYTKWKIILHELFYSANPGCTASFFRSKVIQVFLVANSRQAWLIAKCYYSHLTKSTSTRYFRVEWHKPHPSLHLPSEAGWSEMNEAVGISMLGRHFIYTTTTEGGIVGDRWAIEGAERKTPKCCMYIMHIKYINTHTYTLAKQVATIVLTHERAAHKVD